MAANGHDAADMLLQASPTTLIGQPLQSRTIAQPAKLAPTKAGVAHTDQASTPSRAAVTLTHTLTHTTLVPAKAQPGDAQHHTDDTYTTPLHARPHICTPLATPHLEYAHKHTS